MSVVNIGRFNYIDLIDMKHSIKKKIVARKKKENDENWNDEKVKFPQEVSQFPTLRKLCLFLSLSLLLFSLFRFICENEKCFVVIGSCKIYQLKWKNLIERKPNKQSENQSTSSAIS